MSPSFWRKGHGAGAGEPRIEVPPADELGQGRQAAEHAEAGDERRADGKWRKGARTAQSKGGRALKRRTMLSHQLGLAGLTEQTDFAPYRRKADAFAKAQRGALAASVGGGVCGPGPSSMVASAALQLAASRYLSDRAAIEGDADLFQKASRLADASRQNLLAAHELCAREAKARPPTPADTPWLIQAPEPPQKAPERADAADGAEPAPSSERPAERPSAAKDGQQGGDHA